MVNLNLDGFMLRVILMTFATLGLTASANALAPQRTALYDCAYMNDDSFVEGLTIYHSVLGRREFYEVMVRASVDGDYRETFKTVNLVSTYEGRVQTYGTGNFRVKVNRVFPTEGKYKAFARIPQYDMHSQDWTCKDSL